MESNVITIDDIRTAADLLKGQILRTPAINSPGLSKLTGADVYLKLEN
jgi:threonine dehydratase